MKKLVVRTHTAFFFSLVFLLQIMLAGCESYDEQEAKLKDTPDRGTIYVSADESFKPIIDSEVQVYESQHPGTRIIVTYKPEAECLKDMAVDSVRMIIATRGYSKQEENFMVDSMKVAPEKMVVAYDAIAVVVNPRSPDSLFTMNEIRQILTGTYKKDIVPVFDNTKETSTIRFIIDSVLRGQPLTTKAMAAKSSPGVIEYISKNANAIGFIGVSWVGDRDDTMQVSFLKRVKMAQLESMDIPGNYVLPVQANIFLHRYPMIRDVTYILKENYKGLGHGFANFLSGEKGQLIFKRAYLVPAQQDFRIRPIRLNE
ncbi:MAG: substrate-binding domain-containing protein [Chitinophagaceae bacterium]|nr:substrate-binding domain-containing protein [Chitinophagaceae bacterium]OQY96131.1 MAG: phosphate ABC transporter substrate-binding protein, PhoT family [Sphingobacteriales bacterium UTBCD1]